MTTHKEIGATIREARLGESMSLGQLASAIGRSSSSVRRWERGEVAPAVSVVPKLAAILDIDPDELRTTDSAVSGSDETDGRISTVEQAVMDSVGDTDMETDPPTNGTVEGSGFVAEMWASIAGGGRGWMRWVRGLLTAAALVVMLLVFVWAVGELLDALSAVLGSFEVGSNGDQ